MKPRTIHKIIQETCKSNGCPEVVDLIKVKWSNRLVASMGTARRVGKSFLITLSTKLFERIDEEEQRDTVIHEVCHIIDSILNQRRMSHGEGWKAAMRRAGRKPTRTHAACTEGLTKRFIYSCTEGCCEHRLHTRTHNQIVKGAGRVCKSCKEVIKFTGRVEEPTSKIA